LVNRKVKSFLSAWSKE